MIVAPHVFIKLAENSPSLKMDSAFNRAITGSSSKAVKLLILNQKPSAGAQVRGAAMH
jgi:hypothetical protein